MFSGRIHSVGCIALEFTARCDPDTNDVTAPELHRNPGAAARGQDHAARGILDPRYTPDILPRRPAVSNKQQKQTTTSEIYY